MSRLGSFLQQTREQQDRSRRWVERQSKILYTSRSRQISHSYLREIEAGRSENPSPDKLLTLSQIYGIEPAEILRMAGHDIGEVIAPRGREQPPDPAEPQAGVDTAPRSAAAPSLEHTWKAMEHLRSHGINPSYFLNAISQLGGTSLQLLSRLVTTLSVQEAAARDTKGRRQEGVEA